MGKISHGFYLCLYVLGFSTGYGMSGYGRVLTRFVSGDPVPIAAPQSTDTDDEE